MWVLNSFIIAFVIINDNEWLFDLMIILFVGWIDDVDMQPLTIGLDHFFTDLNSNLRIYEWIKEVDILEEIILD